MKTVIPFFFVVLTFICFFSSCNGKEEISEQDIPNLEGFYSFEGFIVDQNDLPMGFVEVNLQGHETSDGGSGWWGEPGNPNLSRSTTDANGFYSVLFSKKELFDIFSRDKHHSFSLQFTIVNAIGIPLFESRQETIEIDFEDNQMELNKKLNSGAHVTIIKRDNPNIELSTDSEMSLESDLKHWSENTLSVMSGRAYKVYETDTLMKEIRVGYDMPLVISWKARGSNYNTYYTQMDTVQLAQGEDYIYWLEY